MYLKKTSIKVISLILACSILLVSCSSTTMINSVPSDAIVFINGERVGKTPYLHSDSKTVGSTTLIKLEKEGYEPFYASFSRDESFDVGACIGGLFFLVPFLWIMKYKNSRSFELFPLMDNQESIIKTEEQEVLSQSKAEKLRELKKLLDENILTVEEYEKEKKKILDSD